MDTNSDSFHSHKVPENLHKSAEKTGSQAFSDMNIVMRVSNNTYFFAPKIQFTVKILQIS